jgi:hypothetical protein
VAGSDLVLIFGMDMAGSLLDLKLAGKIKSGGRRAKSQYFAAFRNRGRRSNVAGARLIKAEVYYHGAIP